MTGTTNERKFHVVLGTGPLAQGVMRALLRRDKSVRMVNRSGRADVPTTVAVARGDLYDAVVVRSLCADAAVVYQCAQPAYQDWQEKFPPLQASIIEGIAASGARLVVAENLYMYGPVTVPMTEELPHSATTRKGRTRASMSEALLAAHRAGKLRVAIGRGADFYGPGVLDSALGDRVFYPALAGKTTSAIGDLDQPHTYTYIDDFGDALVQLGANDIAFGQIWHVPNAPTVTTRAVLGELFALLGTPPKMSGMGKVMMRLGGIFIPGARETVEMMYEFDRPFIVDHIKYARAFGDAEGGLGEAITPIREGLRRTLDWYRANPQKA
jgi:nucleoside-diphosphate-sugar epimerase